MASRAGRLLGTGLDRLQDFYLAADYAIVMEIEVAAMGHSNGDVDDAAGFVGATVVDAYDLALAVF